MNNESNLLAAAHAAWCARSAVLAKRARLKRYTYGDQWGDYVTDSLGRVMREGDVVAATGRQPLANNLIRRLVKTIVGRYRNIAGDSGRYSDRPGSPDVLNALPELDARLLEEFLISGMAIQRVSRERRHGGPERVWVDNVNPRMFFSNAFADPRGTDLQMVGMLHNMSIYDVLARFGRGDRRRMAQLRNIFAADTTATRFPAFSGDADFFTAPDGQCRLVELWTLDAFESSSRQGGATVNFRWRCRWLAPGGECLDSYFSPWRHGSHPFVLKYYPLTDGEVHPFVEDVVDQQRYINRLIVLIDHMMGASAKGVLLFPLDQLPKGLTMQQVTDRWSAADGVIPITGKGMTMPQQVVAGANDAGAYRLLELEMKLFQDVSGVSDAILGHVATGNGGSALYESQVQNATIALRDIFDTFASLTAARDEKIKTL